MIKYDSWTGEIPRYNNDNRNSKYLPLIKDVCISDSGKVFRVFSDTGKSGYALRASISGVLKALKINNIKLVSTRECCYLKKI